MRSKRRGNRKDVSIACCISPLPRYPDTANLSMCTSTSIPGLEGPSLLCLVAKGCQNLTWPKETSAGLATTETCDEEVTQPERGLKQVLPNVHSTLS